MRQIPNINRLEDIYCVTFGTPLIGTKSVQEFVSAKRGDFRIADHILTIVHQKDLVPGALNINLTLERATETLSKYESYFDTITMFYRPLGYVKDVAKIAAAGLNQFAQGQPEFHPIGCYRFIETENGNQALSPNLKDYNKIKKKLSTGVTFNSTNIDAHNLHSYEFALTTALKIEKVREKVLLLPPTPTLFEAMKSSESLPADLNKYYLSALSKIHVPKVTMLIKVANKDEYKLLSTLLFKMGVFRIVCFASAYSFLSDAFYAKFPHVFVTNYNEDTFEHEYSSPIADFTLSFPCSEQSKAIFKKDSVEVSIFKCSFRRFYPYNASLPPYYYSLEDLNKKWDTDLEKKHMKHEDIRIFKGGVVVCRDRFSRASDTIGLWIFRQKCLRRIKKERYENALKIATLSSSFFVVLSTSKPVQLAVKSFGSMVINYNGQTMTITKFTEVLADQLSAALVDLRGQHEQALKEIINHQKDAMNELWKGFNFDHEKISEIGLQKQQEVLRNFNEQLKEIYDYYWWSSSSRERYADSVLNEQEMKLAEINQSQQKQIQDLQNAHMKELQDLQQKQSAEFNQLQEKWELERVDVLKKNQLIYVGKAVVYGAAIGAITALFVNIVKESRKYYNERKPLPRAIWDVVSATAKVSFIGAVSGGIITTVETWAEILPANSFLKTVLKGNGNLIVSTIFFTFDLLVLMYRWMNNELTTKQMMSSIAAKSLQFTGMTILGLVGSAAAVSLGGTGLIVAAATILGSLVGSFVGSKAGKAIDEYYIRSQDERLVKAYETLGIPAYSNIEVVNKAFRKLALQYHEDKVKDFPKDIQDQFREKFFEINLAVETIRNDEYLKAEKKLTEVIAD